MLIDVHAQLGYATPGAPNPRQLASYADSCGLEYVLVSNRDAASLPSGAADRDEAEANVACLKACQVHAALVPLYRARPGRMDSHIHAMAGALALEPFVGVVFAPEENGFDAGAPLLEPYLAALEAAGRPGLFCVSLDPRGTPARVYDAARRHPRLPIVMVVTGPSRAAWAAALDTLRTCLRLKDANLFLATAHAKCEDMAAAVQALDADHFLYGGMCQDDSEAASGGPVSFLKELRGLLSPEAFAAVSGGNAAKLFGLTPRRSGHD